MGSASSKGRQIQLIEKSELACELARDRYKTLIAKILQIF